MKLRTVAVVSGRVVVVGIAAIAVVAVMDHLVIARGESVSHSLFWKTGGFAAKGEYVTFLMAHPIINESGEPAWLTKKVGCMEGETIEHNGVDFFCGADKLGEALTETWDGRRLVAAELHGVIPAGRFFAVGEHPRSFDSRYFGLVDKASVTRVVPLW